MPIAVVCPNGHRLACPDDRAGKTGKCPKCDTSFEIPFPADVAEAEPVAEADSSVSAESPEAEAASSPSNKAPADNIVFLCPNGHKLNGPSSLQGQPGQCPHCGAKFRIPVYDDESDQEQLETPEEDSTLGDGGDEDLLQLNIGEIEEAEEISIDDLEELSDIGSNDDAIDAEAVDEPVGEFYGDAEPVDIHPLARLFATLWNERQHGGVIEVHLAEREVILPDWWAESLSLESHGVFALQTADGSYVIETVAWDSIKRITVRRINELPDGVFA
ncbi:MAG: hypothetical protein KDA42_03080 [Planctomycetales bacterium]|nr:hypothetical protein [Planctomycetales bacterium]